LTTSPAACGSGCSETRASRTPVISTLSIFVSSSKISWLQPA
jgi:hypothetical protein